MALLIKNKTDSPIEIDELGITIPVGGYYDLSDDIEPSGELDVYIISGDIVYMDDSDPENIIERTIQDSIQVSKATSGIDLTSFYRKDEIDQILTTLVLNSAVYHKDACYSKSEIDVIIDNIVNGSPELLDTLSEIAAALGNDANFTQTITDQLANKASLIHNHDGQYYNESEVDSKLDIKSPINHTHDGSYSTIGHTHSGYSEENHNHNNEYSPSGHNHDQAYSPSGHNHDERYFTESEVSAMLSTIKFGRDYDHAESIAVKTSSSTSFINKVTLSATVSESGWFRIGWNYNWNSNSIKDDFRARVMLGGVVINDHQQEPPDTNGGFWSTGTNQKMPVSGFARVNLSPGNHIITIEFCSSKSNKLASMWDAKLEFWMVS